MNEIKNKKGKDNFESSSLKNSFYSSLIVGIAFLVGGIIMLIYKLNPSGYNERYGQHTVSSPFVFLGFSFVLLTCSYFLNKQLKKK